MENIIDYVEREFRTFEECPFHDVDSLVLSWLTYIKWPMRKEERADEYIYPIRDMFQAEHFDHMFETIMDKDSTKALLTAVVASPRFRNIRLRNYETDKNPDEDKQFAAVTFMISDDLWYVGFRGTDSSYVGWKEDLELACQYPIASQEAAVTYLNHICKVSTAKIMVGGHSKGGNLAVCAAANNSRYDDRIEKIYTHDAPGFLKGVLNSPEFLQIQDRIDKTVPQSSIIGMLLEQREDYQVVSSNAKGFGQHDPFTWDVENGQFVSMPELTKDAVILNHAIDSWLDTLSLEQRTRFVDTVFDLLGETETSSFLEFGKEMQTNLTKVFSSFSDLDKETRAFMLKTAASLIKFAIKSIPEDFRKQVVDPKLEQWKDLF